MNRVWEDETIKSTRKLLFLALADFSNDEGVCYPSQDTLVKKCGLSKATVNKYIKEFEDENILIQVKRKRKSGGRISSKYLLFPNENYHKLDEKEREIFSQSLEVKPASQSLEVKPKNSSQSLEVKPKPSLSLFNHHLFNKMTRAEKDLYIEYVKLRKIMKLKTTEDINNRLLNTYFDLGRNPKIIENAINANWRDFYPLKNFEQQKTQEQKQQEAIERVLERKRQGGGSLFGEIGL
jgi:biotin operon repressor